jgi:S1-C subfamily serine protease
MGVVLKEREDSKGIWIERVLPESHAEKAGLLPGDQFIAIEGREITKVKDCFFKLQTVQTIRQFCQVDAMVRG